MNLSFSTHWPKKMPDPLAGQPTYFVEKIWASIKELPVTVELANFVHSKYSTSKSILEVNPKRHTIRQDTKDRWKAGNDIHFIINARSKDRLQFAPVLKVVSIQKIEIKYFVKNNANKVSIKIDGKEATLYDLATNDGFETPADFLDWFNKDFTGKIIHWTNLKY